MAQPPIPAPRFSATPRVPLDENAARIAAEAPPPPPVADDKPARNLTARQPFGMHEQNLAWPPIPGYRLYWFNDLPGRIARAKRAGYEHVISDDTGEPVARNVGKQDGGSGMNAYLMRIPEEWYREDMANAQESRERILREIKEGRYGDKPGQNQYVPGQGINIGDRR